MDFSVSGFEKPFEPQSFEQGFSSFFVKYLVYLMNSKTIKYAKILVKNEENPSSWNCLKPILIKGTYSEPVK